MSIKETKSIFQHLIDKYDGNSKIYKSKSLLFLYAIVFLLLIGVFAVIFSRELARVDGEIAKASKSDEISKLSDEKKRLDQLVSTLKVSIDSVKKINTKNLDKGFAYGWQSYNRPKKKNRILDFANNQNEIYAVGSNGLIAKLLNNNYELISSTENDYYTGATILDEYLYISSLEGNIYRRSLNSGKTDLIASKDKAITSIESSNSSDLIIATTLGGFYLTSRKIKTWNYIDVIQDKTFNDSYYDLGKVWLVGSNGVLVKYDLQKQTHSIVKLPTISNLHSICGNSSNNTLAISGSDGVILISKDQGITWELKQSRNFNKDLYSISINRKGDYLCAVGASNSLLTSNNGGDSWELIENHQISERTLFSCTFNGENQSVIIGGENHALLHSDENYENNRLDNQVSEYEEEKEKSLLREKEIIKEIESMQLPLQKSSDLLFHIATNTTRIAIILLIVFLVKILLNQHRYYQRLSVFYSSRSDIVKYVESMNLTPSEGRDVIALLVPDSIEMGTTPDLNYSSLLDLIKNLKQ